MAWQVSIWNSLVQTALGGLIVFTMGGLAVRFCRQPVRRVRLVVLTLLAYPDGALARHIPLPIRFPVVPRWLTGRLPSLEPNHSQGSVTASIEAGPSGSTWLRIRACSVPNRRKARSMPCRSARLLPGRRPMPAPVDGHPWSSAAWSPSPGNGSSSRCTPHVGRAAGLVAPGPAVLWRVRAEQTVRAADGRDASSPSAGRPASGSGSWRATASRCPSPTPGPAR